MKESKYFQDTRVDDSNHPQWTKAEVGRRVHVIGDVLQGRHRHVVEESSVCALGTPVRLAHISGLPGLGHATEKRP
jgi:hypothetical protein